MIGGAATAATAAVPVMDRITLASAAPANLPATGEFPGVFLVAGQTARFAFAPGPAVIRIAGFAAVGALASIPGVPETESPKHKRGRLAGQMVESPAELNHESTSIGKATRRAFCLTDKIFLKKICASQGEMAL
jgi:hypothetical protein